MGGQRRFTIVELMTCVAIVGLLASIAIPKMSDFQNRAKASEGFTNLAALRTATAVYLTNASTPSLFTDFHPRCAGDANKEIVPWDPAPAIWAELGWAPDGGVRCVYSASVWGGEVFAGATCDVDDDDWILQMIDRWDLDQSVSTYVAQDLCYEWSGCGIPPPPETTCTSSGGHDCWTTCF